MPEDCSRAKSRVARALLRKRGILGAAMPATCPLHADLYGDQEQHKRALRRSLYKCAYCGKTFSSEDWLDRHFDRKHADTLAADGFCLGDLCDVLDCAAAPRLARTRPSYYDDDDGARDDDGYRGARRRRRYDDDGGDDDRPATSAQMKVSREPIEQTSHGAAVVAWVSTARPSHHGHVVAETSSFEIHRLIPAQAGPRRGEARFGPRDALRRRFPGGRPREVQGGARGLLAGGRGRRALRRALRERKGARRADRRRRSRGGGRAGRGQPTAVRRLPRRLLRVPLLLHARLVVVVARRATEAVVAGATAPIPSAGLSRL